MNAREILFRAKKGIVIKSDHYLYIDEDGFLALRVAVKIKDKHFQSVATFRENDIAPVVEQKISMFCDLINRELRKT